jgi:hypothetical protein
MMATRQAKQAAPTASDRRADTEARLAELRAEIERQREAMERADHGLLPPAEFAEAIGQWVDAQARQFEDGEIWQGLNALAVPRPRYDRVSLLRPPVRGAGAANPAVVAQADATGLLAWLLKDTIKARAAEFIHQRHYQAGPPASERADLRREAQAELDKLERQEEAIIEQAEAAGMTLPRRVDARPEIVLSLETPA